jgi:hypothetical protein
MEYLENYLKDKRLSVTKDAIGDIQIVSDFTATIL